MKKPARSLSAVLTAALLFPSAMSVSAADSSGYLPLNRGGEVYSDRQGTAYASCNDVYYDAWNGAAGSWLAYDISAKSAGYSGLLLAWYSGAWNNYDYTVLPESPGASLSGYTVEINTAPGGSLPSEGWVTVQTVKDYTCHSGQTAINNSSRNVNWVRITADSIQGGGSQISLNVDLHGTNDRLADSWMFYGDSITAGGMTTFSSGDGNFADLVHQIDPRHYPAQENGGIGGIFSTDGRKHIDRWLKQFPGKYVSIAYGTNDCWGNQTGAARYYENTAYMIQAIQAAGKIAVLPTIPFSKEPGISANIDSYNAQIKRICEENEAVIPGPDFYAFFREHPEYLGADGVHPSTEGYNEMRKLWAKTVCETVYANEGDVPDSPAGDVNGDGAVSVADAVLLVRFLTAETAALPHWQNADLDQSGKLDASDLAMLKHLLLTA